MVTALETHELGRLLRHRSSTGGRGDARPDAQRVDGAGLNHGTADLVVHARASASRCYCRDVVCRPGDWIVKGADLVAFKREYSAAETRESTYMRAAFAYVSLEMFKDRPVMGFGFNQFQVYNLPYLADRSTDIRVESIRGYVHHNSFLSVLVDLGIIGFGCMLSLA